MEGSAIRNRGKRGSEGNTKGRSLGVGVVRGERKIIKKEGFKKKYGGKLCSRSPDDVTILNGRLVKCRFNVFCFWNNYFQNHYLSFCEFPCNIR